MRPCQLDARKLVNFMKIISIEEWNTGAPNQLFTHRYRIGNSPPPLPDAVMSRASGTHFFYENVHYMTEAPNSYCITMIQNRAPKTTIKLLIQSYMWENKHCRMGRAREKKVWWVLGQWPTGKSGADGMHYPDDIARLRHSDGHVLAEWFYCDHQSALAEYGLTSLSVLSLGGVSVCSTHSAVEKWKSLRPGSTQWELPGLAR